MTARANYLVHSTGSEPDLAAVCKAVYDAVESRAVFAHVDIASDFDDQMPDDIKTVETWFIARCAADAAEGPAKRAKVTSTEAPGWDFTQAYTPWSIHVELFDDVGRSVASFHDCGHTIIASLDDGEAAELAERLPYGHDLEPLIPVHDDRNADADDDPEDLERRSGVRKLLGFTGFRSLP